MIVVQVRQKIDFKTYKLTIHKIEREFELLDISSHDTSYRSQFMIRTRFSYYKDALKKLNQELSK